MRVGPLRKGIDSNLHTLNQKHEQKWINVPEHAIVTSAFNALCFHCDKFPSSFNLFS
jgi:hypothetical protein